MQFFWLNLLVFLLGLATGSFLNCVIFRLAGSASFLKGRSVCPKCKHQLGWKDIIPVASYIILGGKCRYCKRKISRQYPIIETTTALLFLLIFNGSASLTTLSLSKGFQFLIFNQFLFFNFQTLANLAFLFTIASFLIVIFVYDLKHYIIPDKIIYPAIVITLFYRLFENLIIENWKLIENWSLKIENLMPSLFYFYAAMGAALFFALIVLISRGKWMGVGDIKLAFLMGLLLGWPNILVALFFAFMAGALVGLAMIAAKKKTMKSEVPFGPFLVAGVFIALFSGNAIINWYWSLLLF